MDAVLSVAIYGYSETATSKIMLWTAYVDEIFEMLVTVLRHLPGILNAIVHQHLKIVTNMAVAK